MKLTTIIFLIFLLGAFTIGINLSETQLTPQNITDFIDNSNITEIELNYSEDSSEQGFLKVSRIIKVLELYIRFLVALVLEVMFVGIQFGYDNPQYFEPGFIFGIMKLIIILLIISLLIKPITYLIIFIILFFIWLHNLLRNRRKRRSTKKDLSS